MVSHLLLEFREFLPKQVRSGPFEFHSSSAEGKLGWIFKKEMDMLRIHSHPNYPYIQILGNRPDYLLASYCNITIQQRFSIFGAENHMISKKRYRMAVMTQAPAFVFLITFGFHRALTSLAKEDNT